MFVLVVHVAGVAPGPIPATDGGGGGDLRWINGSQPKKIRLKEEDFLDINNNNLQTQSAGLLQSRSVSTGLGLSLDDRRLASSGVSQFFSLSDDQIDRELQRQEAEIDRLVKVQVHLFRFSCSLV